MQSLYSSGRARERPGVCQNPHFLFSSVTPRATLIGAEGKKILKIKNSKTLGNIPSEY